MTFGFSYILHIHTKLQSKPKHSLFLCSNFANQSVADVIAVRIYRAQEVSARTAHIPFVILDNNSFATIPVRHLRQLAGCGRRKMAAYIFLSHLRVTPTATPSMMICTQ